MNNLFATKKVERANTQSTKDEDEESVKEKEPDNEKFTNLLSQINNIDYKGYKYTLKDTDYFVNNNKKYMTINTKLRRCRNKKM